MPRIDSDVFSSKVRAERDRGDRVRVVGFLMIILRVHLGDDAASVEVPVTPDSTGQDVIDCVRDPSVQDCRLVERWKNYEREINPEENMSILLEAHGTEEEEVKIFLQYGSDGITDPADNRRYGSPHSSASSSPIPGRSSPLVGRRAQLRRGRESAAAAAQSRSAMLPGGMDLTLTELQEMASRQQQQIESQQQVLVAKEQRLKYLKQQEQRHSHLSAEQDRLRRLREKVETQELKLKKLRALRGQVEQHKASNGNLNSELDSVKALFNEKEKELTMAVAKVEQLTRQLEDIRTGKINGINGDTQTAAVLELEKLRKELLQRNKVNEQQNNRLSAQRELLQHKKDEMKQMDFRIQELQQRIKKKKSQQQTDNKNMVNKNRPSTNIAAVEPYIQVAPKDKEDMYQKAGFEKKDPKQVQSTNTKFPSGENKNMEDFPVKPSNQGKELNNNSRENSQSRENSVSKSANNQNVSDSKSREPECACINFKSTCFTSWSWRISVANIAAKFSARPYGSTFSTSVLPGRVAPIQQQPVISITEEERQAGSGQSSPASSDSSQNSPSSNKPKVLARFPQPQTNTTFHGRVPTSQSSQNDTKTVPQQQPVHPPPVSSKTAPHPALRGAATSSPSQSPQQNSPRNGSDNSLDATDSARQEQPNRRTVYATKNAIMNTYMGRLGSSAMQKYQQNLDALYKNADVKGTGDRPDHSPLPSGGNPGLEQRTAFNQPSSGDSNNGAKTHTHFGLVGLPQYQSIASDKGSYRLNTPKHIRRKQSDSENEDLSKLLHGGYDRQGANQKINSGVNSGNNQSSALETVKQTDSNSATSNSKGGNSPPLSDSSRPPQPPGDGVVRRKKTNLKKDKSRKSGNRVSFDPLALLLDASLEGEIELVRRTAREVTDVSAPNDEGITALHNAICAGHYEIVVFLVEFGCDVNSPDSDGWTPLHCAASCNNLPMVKFLVEHGACIFATTISDHETAAEKCEEDEDGYDGCSDYLYSIQEKLGIMNNGEVYAVFDYDSSNSDELSFKIGDKITILRKGDEREKEWWWARRNDKEGYVPRNLLGMYARVMPTK
ncbi:LOW QUALITY PROTEIN: apoptosis-stimulating of p53 protein 2-like [Haliotis rubra]|uniref:LOW QUALITY PROTEIN: apoptosis-stimulating of p53 protein 2-like n=1 Tax=Haliotis rubra TaxID=36100 RepID=UPI001EE55D48|nr:LOW QUALITY PROTEIN: apoptosis-stimulating of p53 protein 2-like [Haliotis rubra]